MSPGIWRLRYGEAVRNVRFCNNITASIAVAFRAVTMLAASFERGGALDRILQNRTGIAEAPRRRCARMSNWLRFRQDFPASGAKALSPVRFGTAVLSELSAFATIKYRAERSG